MKNKKIKISIIIVMLYAIGITAMANRQVIFDFLGTAFSNDSRDALDDKKDPVDREIVEELVQLAKQFDSAAANLYFEGRFTAVDKMDTANALRNIPYTFYKTGEELYFRIGNTESINTKALYVYIDHPIKKIIVGAPKKVIMPSPNPPLDLMLDMIKEEGFTVSKSIESGIAAISLQSETHVSCKEYTVRYDAVGKSLRSIFLRLADISDPLDKEREKWTFMDIVRYDDTTQRNDLLQISRFVRQTSAGWMPAQDLNQYDLVEL